MKKRIVFDICLIAVLIALGVVFSAFLQIPIYSDIRLDLSYIIIVYICYRFGALYGGFSAMSIAMLESTLFTAYGFSISWATANFVLGAIIGLSFQLTKGMKNKPLYYIINVSSIVLAVAIGMLGIKTLIECKLYEIPFNVKIVKNSVAFGLDLGVSLLGFLVLLPRMIILDKKDEVKDE